MTETNREGDLPSTGPFLKWPQQPDLAESEARNQELHPGLSCGWQGSKHWDPEAHSQGAGSEVEQAGLELVLGGHETGTRQRREAATQKTAASLSDADRGESCTWRAASPGAL